MDVNVLPALWVRESDPSGIKLLLLVPELRNGRGGCRESDMTEATNTLSHG